MFKKHLLFFIAVFCILSIPFDRAYSFEQVEPSVTKKISVYDTAYRFQLYGRHPLRGDYSGILEIRWMTEPQRCQAQRIVNFQTFKYRDLSVQEIWNGQCHFSAEKNTIDFEFRIQKRRFIKKLGESERDLSQPQTQEISLSLPWPLPNQIQWGEYSDAIYNFEDTSTKEPLFTDQRVVNPSHGPPGLLVGLIKKFIMTDYYGQPPFSKYEEDLSFKLGIHSFVSDQTHFDFYRQNPKVLRVLNVQLDEISLAEDYVRQIAFSQTLDAKEGKFRTNLIERHLDPSGMVEIAQLDNDGNVSSRVSEGDSTLWTGIYVMTEAFRFWTTGDRQSLELIKNSVRGLITLVNITNDPKIFARTLKTIKPGENVVLSAGWHQGQGEYNHLLWLEGGNNDMFSGLIVGLLYGYLSLPDTEIALKNEIRNVSKRILNLDESNPSDNKTLALGLSALVNNDEELKEKYRLSHGNFITRLPTLGLTGALYVDGIADWSGINLQTVSLISALVIAEKLGQFDVVEALQKEMISNWRCHMKTRQPMVSLAALAFARDRVERVQGPWKKTTAVQDVLWSLREVPYPRQSFPSVEIDHSIRSDFVLSPLFSQPWKYLKKNPPDVDWGLQSLVNYPIFEANSFVDGFLWKAGAFNYKAAATSNFEQPGVDYLWIYWMARYYKILIE